ncbi:acyl-CoA dehydrogenase family protein [Actinokineospora sp. G85]|uniref:acyl-CoA dehydrogenase family protein n=1 Tax=Actinokineospora sp. G85 TaxID=3406626 RepID=UPI003C71DE03
MSAPLTVLDPADQEWRDRARTFAEKRIAPLSATMDKSATLDPAVRTALFEEGFMGVEIPRRYGGAGGGLFQMMIVIEEIARVDPGVAVGVDVHNALVAATLLRQAGGDQRRQFLPRLAAGAVGAFALSEEQAGSDAFALSTTATPDGDTYVLSGRKRWTSNARNADLFLLFATVPGKGPTAFLVDRDTAGITLDHRVEQLGVRAAATSDLVLDGAVVRKDRCVNGVGNGQAVAVAALDVGRVGIAAQLVGLAQGALDLAVDYARGREQFGSRVGDYQGVRFPLAQAATEVAAARTLTYEVVRQIEHGADPVERLRAAAMAKLFASQVADRTAALAVEVLGGNGYTDAYPAERLYRDAKAGRIYEGTDNILLRGIGAILLGERR